MTSAQAATSRCPSRARFLPALRRRRFRPPQRSTPRRRPASPSAVPAASPARDPRRPHGAPWEPARGRSASAPRSSRPPAQVLSTPRAFFRRMPVDRRHRRAARCTRCSSATSARGHGALRRCSILLVRAGRDGPDLGLGNEFDRASSPMVTGGTGLLIAARPGPVRRWPLGALRRRRRHPPRPDGRRRRHGGASKRRSGSSPMRAATQRVPIVPLCGGVVAIVWCAGRGDHRPAEAHETDGARRARPCWCRSCWCAAAAWASLGCWRPWPLGWCHDRTASWTRRPGSLSAAAPGGLPLGAILGACGVRWALRRGPPAPGPAPVLGLLLQGRHRLACLTCGATRAVGRLLQLDLRAPWP